MYITLHLSDGRKITKDKGKLRVVTTHGAFCDKDVEEGTIVVSAQHIVDMRPAEQDEINHAKIHGW